MKSFDVFNGDADGICALVQLRCAEPRDSVLVTGVKRDIDLLRNIETSPGDRVTVLDVSMDKNREPLQSVLASGAQVFYVDHHFPGDIPDHAGLTALIRTESDICTSLLVNEHLGGRFALWAVVGAFGDNLDAAAVRCAEGLGLGGEELEQLKCLGIYINYNGYGSDLDDLYFTPADLYRSVSRFTDPREFMARAAEDFQQLEQGYHGDMQMAGALAPEMRSPAAAVFILPDEPWARRVSGVYSNDLANRHPARAHAVLTEKPGNNYLVSVRAPLDNKTGADALCRQFPTGGGRAAAAGINDLPADRLSDFVATFTEHFSNRR